MIIETCAANGGHLASYLGVVELTLALHSVFRRPPTSSSGTSATRPTSTSSSPAGGTSSHHPHVRRPLGLLLRDESPPTTPSAPATPARRSPRRWASPSPATTAASDEHVVAIIGDGAITCGLAFEGLNNAGHLGSRLIVVLNDNEMSIAPNVGALAVSDPELARAATTARRA